MSWSDNRSKESQWSIETIRSKVNAVNGVLEKLSNDEYLHEDLKDPIVQKALKHWTGEQRLSMEEASKFEENRRVIYVLQRFQILRSVCYDAKMPIPLDLLVNKITKLPKELIKKTYGVDLDKNESVPQASVQKADSKAKPKPVETTSTTTNESQHTPTAKVETTEERKSESNKVSKSINAPQPKIEERVDNWPTISFFSAALVIVIAVFAYSNLYGYNN